VSYLHSDLKLVVGAQYRILMRQMGLKSKSPWVAAEIAGITHPGKIKHEDIGADGKAYLLVTLPGFAGTLIFRLDDVRETANGPVAQATLFLHF
jgi:hypothetical protein